MVVDWTVAQRDLTTEVMGWFEDVAKPLHSEMPHSRPRAPVPDFIQCGKVATTLLIVRAGDQGKRPPSPLEKEIRAKWKHLRKDLMDVSHKKIAEQYAGVDGGLWYSERLKRETLRKILQIDGLVQSIFPKRPETIRVIADAAIDAWKISELAGARKAPKSKGPDGPLCDFVCRALDWLDPGKNWKPEHVTSVLTNRRHKS